MKVDKNINYPFTNKELAAREHIDNMNKKILTMFNYEGLPETLPKTPIELMILDGYIWVTYINDDEIINYPDTPQLKGGLYAFDGIGGTYPDFYGRSTVIHLAHPRLKGPIKREVGKDIVKIKNDSLGTGLYTLNKRYASLLTENEISILIADIQTRTPSIIVADNDTSKKSAEEFMNQVNNGSIGVVMGKQFNENAGLTSLDYSSTASNSITNLIELEQYLKASWFNELGLNSNYNMKRESLNSAETDMNFDSLIPLPYDMLTNRQNGWDRVNEMFGTNIKVSFNEPFKWLLDNDSEDVSSLNEEIINNEPVENDTTNPVNDDSTMLDSKVDKDEIEVAMEVTITETSGENDNSSESDLEGDKINENQGNC